MKKWSWLALLVVLLDQGVKCLAIRLTGDVTLIPGMLRFTYTENTGMAFSLFAGQSWWLGVVSALCIALGTLTLRNYRLGTLSHIAAMLMLGGAVGNMLDRFLRGYVVDMFETLFVDFAIFNVADAALTTGTILMAASLLLRPEEWQKKPIPTEAEKKG